MNEIGDVSMPDDHRHLPRCPGTSTADILAADPRPAPAFLGEGDVEAIDGAEFGVAAYTDAAFHQREVDTVWSRCWQVAARADELAKPGDFVVYDIVDRSAVIVRGKDGVLRAFATRMGLMSGSPLTRRNASSGVAGYS